MSNQGCILEQITAQFGERQFKVVDTDEFKAVHATALAAGVPATRETTALEIADLGSLRSLQVCREEITVDDITAAGNYAEARAKVDRMVKRDKFIDKLDESSGVARLWRSYQGIIRPDSPEGGKYVPEAIDCPPVVNRLFMCSSFIIFESAKPRQIPVHDLTADYLVLYLQGEALERLAARSAAIV